MKQKEMLSEEIRCLRFYTGDIRQEEKKDPVFSDEKAYVTLNSLLFDGIETETARVGEGRKLNPSFLTHLDETLDIMNHLLQGMKWNEEETTVFRVERKADYRIFHEKKEFESFISCSDAGFLESYEDKYDLVLMEIRIKKGVLCVKMEDVLEDYLKAQEKETLIAPYQRIICREDRIPEQYLTIRDGRGNPPCIYTRVSVYPEIPSDTKESSVSEDDILSSCRVFEALNAGILPQNSDLLTYFYVKKHIRDYVLSKLQNCMK